MKLLVLIDFIIFLKIFDDGNIYDCNSNYSKILNQELDKLYNFSFVLRKKIGMLLNEMLQSLYKYSSSINAKGKENSPESLFMTHYI